MLRRHTQFLPTEDVTMLLHLGSPFKRTRLSPLLSCIGAVCPPATPRVSILDPNPRLKPEPGRRNHDSLAFQHRASETSGKKNSLF